MRTRLLLILVGTSFAASLISSVFWACLPGKEAPIIAGLFTINALLASFTALLLFSRSLRTLDEVSSVFATTVSKVYSAAQKTSAMSVELSESRSKQAASLQQTVTSLGQVSSTVSLIAENSANSRKISERSQSIAQGGKEAVDRVSATIGQLSEGFADLISQSNASQDEMNEITNVIREIGQKTTVINDIVIQTKLLSFNASVEAARAGGLGKGFAVVAEEIGKLAKMSGAAADQISNLLNRSITQVEKTVMNSREKIEALVTTNQEKVSASITSVGDCRKILEEIVQNAIILNQKVSEISIATREQSEGLREVTQSMATLDAITQGNSAATTVASSTGEYMAKQASVLSFWIDSLIVTVRGQVRPSAGVKKLKSRLLAFGKPRLGVTTQIGKTVVPDLLFGDHSMVGQFEAVDALKSEHGGVATIFVRSGGEFVRISTNLMNPDGTRAVGSVLAKNPAFEAVINGHSFSGDLMILEVLYETCYEPIIANEQVIGIYYFGNKKNR